MTDSQGRLAEAATVVGTAETLGVWDPFAPDELVVCASL